MSLVARVKRRAIPIYLLLAILVAAGAWEAARLPSAILPSVTFPIVKVIASVGEEPAARMMPTVTRPLEEAVLRVPGVQSVRSTTSRGSSELSAKFAWGTDMEEALTRVRAETQRVLQTLPAKTSIEVEWMNPAVFPIQGYALTSNTRSQAELRALAEYTLRPALIRIPGVSQVQIQGGRNKEFEVRLDRSALLGAGLSVSDVIGAIKKNNQVLSAGLVETNHELYLTLVSGRVHSVAALSRIAVTSPHGGPPLRLSQLGKLQVADEVSYIRTTADGRPAVLINVLRQPSANTVAIANSIKQMFRHHPELLPRDVTWTNFYDQASFVSASVAGAGAAIFIGVVLAAGVLFVFLRKLWPTLVAVATIPLTVAVVGFGLGVLGRTINLMSMAGVAAAIGLIADDAIVVIENIHRHREENRPEPAQSGIGELVPALVGSSLSTIVILAPFALLPGIVGAFFKPLALTMALCLIISFVLALVVVPVSIAIVYARTGAGPLARLRQRAHRTAIARRLARGWNRVAANAAWLADRVIRFFVDRWPVAVLATLLCLGGAYLLYRSLGSNFLPSMDEGSIILDYWTPPGTSLTDTNEMLDHAENIIMSLPDVASYSRRTGTQLGFFITEPNRGDYVIKLKPRPQRRPIGEVIDELRRRIAAAEPAIHTDFGQLIEDNIGDLTGGEPQPIDVKIYGENQQLLDRTARKVARVVASVRGTEDVFDGIVVAGPALRIEIDPFEAARAGLTTADLRTALAPAIAGAVVDRIRVGERMYDLRVFARGSGGLNDLLVRTKSSALLPLGHLAKITTGKPETEIDRENLRSYVGVTARLSGRSNLGGAIRDIRRRIHRRITLPPGMSIRYGGLYQQQQASFRGLLYVLLSGLVLVAVVVLFEFADWRAPLVTILVAMSALAGVFGLLRAVGMTLNISSFVGAIMMVGIAGENAIFVIHEARLQLRRGAGVKEAWANASRRRLRPVAMTILATGLALAPLALGIGQGAQLIQPLAIGVIGGFALSGPLVLLVLPGLYRLLDRRGTLAGTPTDTADGGGRRQTDPVAEA